MRIRWQWRSQLRLALTYPDWPPLPTRFSSSQMIRQARGYFGIDAKAYGHVGHVDLSALKVCNQYTAGAAGPLSACCILPRMHTHSCRLGSGAVWRLGADILCAVCVACIAWSERAPTRRRVFAP